MAEETRPEEKAPLALMFGIGAVASVLGVVLGLLIDWFPVQGSTQAGPIDTLYDVLIIISVPVFVLVTVIVCFSVWKFRMKPGEENLDGPPIHGNTRLEVIWTTIPAIILVALCTYAYVVLVDIEEAQANEMRINVVGQQFTWTFEYPMGEGQEPVRSNQLYLPQGRPVRFHINSLDVIHDFWVPAFRMKIDAVPGIETDIRVTPTRTGRFPVVCAELCGVGHAFMRQTANVVAPQEFQQWLTQQQQPSQAEGAEGEAPDGATLFAEGNGDATACAACHTLEAAGSQSTTGPDLDEVLPGQTPEEIRQSIVEPAAQVTEGFQPGIMPPNYGDTLSAEELDALVEYLAETTGS